MLKRWGLLLVVFGLMSGSTNASTLLLLDKDNLDQIKAKIDTQDPFVMPAYQTLISKAEKTLSMDRLSVVDKSLTPPSQDKHDYMSLGPYFWPNPKTKDGYPYIRRDGKVNPNALIDSDSPRLVRLANALETLALAYYYTNNTKYAQRAVEMIQIWFINDSTKMNPHLKYAQGIPGTVPGRALGILDGRHFVRILDSITLIENSNLLSSKDLEIIKQWVKDYQNWLLNGEYAYEESHRPNNHGTFYDYQVVGYALYLEQPKKAKELLTNAQYIRLGSHIGSKGQNFHELERTRPLHYSLFDLEAMIGLALYSDHYDDVNFWTFTINQTSLKKAIDYVVKYKNNRDMWLVKNEKVNFMDLTPTLLIATQKYKTDEYNKEILKLWHSKQDDISFMKWNIELTNNLAHHQFLLMSQHTSSNINY